MRSIDLRIPLLVGAAIVLLAVSPAKAAIVDEAIMFVAGTGEQAAPEILDVAPAPSTFAEEDAQKRDIQADLMAMSGKLADPKMQDGVAAMVGNLTEKMMDFPIGKFAVAMEQAIPGGVKDKRGRRIRATDTVADVAGGDADRLPNDLAKGSKQLMGMLSGLTAAFASMIPEFEKLGRDLEESFEDIEDVQRGRD